MNDQEFRPQLAPQPQGEVVQVNLKGGVFPDVDGSWRVCCWIGGMRSEADAQKVAEWMGKLLNANMSPTPPAQPPTPPLKQ